MMCVAWRSSSTSTCWRSPIESVRGDGCRESFARKWRANSTGSGFHSAIWLKLPWRPSSPPRSHAWHPAQPAGIVSIVHACPHGTYRHLGTAYERRRDDEFLVLVLQTIHEITERRLTRTEDDVVNLEQSLLAVHRDVQTLVVNLLVVDAARQVASTFRARHNSILTRTCERLFWPNQPDESIQSFCRGPYRPWLSCAAADTPLCLILG